MAKRNKNSRRNVRKAHFLSSLSGRLMIFGLTFGALGGLFMIFSSQAAILYAPNPPHQAQCIQNTPSKTTVRPGEVFTAQVRIRNTGTSTFHPDFGVLLAEFRDGPSIWSPSGTALSGPVGPGGTATFNLTVRAPNNPGTHSFNWGMLIVFTGYISNPCTGTSVRVMNPPSVTLKANGQDNITVNSGSALTLNWSSTNSPTRCVASGNWGGNKSASGSENRSSDIASAGTRTYTLSCSNSSGSGSATRTVSVVSPPSTPPTTPTPPNQPAPSSPGRQSTPRQSNPQTNNPTVSPTSEPITPPAPNNFSARLTDNSSVSLTWERPSYSGVLSGYELERSIDKQNWEKIAGDMVKNETYTDASVQYEKTYHYRLAAIDSTGGRSEYANVEVTTGSFTANAGTNETILSSNDKLVTVTITEGALSEPAQCSLEVDNQTLPPNKDGYKTAIGPYQILCKTEKGDIVSKFNKPVKVSIRISKDKYSTLAFFAYGDEWSEVSANQSDEITTLELTDQTVFTVLGKSKTTPFFVKLIIALVILGGIIVGGILLLNFIGRYKQRKSMKKKQDDYYHKEHGY